MSRIHDALRRAEEERLANGPVADEITGVLPEPATGIPASYADEVLATPSSAMAAQHAIPGDGLPAAESFLSRLRQPAWTPDMTKLLFMNGNSHIAAGTEEFRTLRARLYQARTKRPVKTILVASAMPSEGKSFVSANLAQVLARQHGRRTLLIDADLRWSRLHDLFGAPSGPGLTEYLSGEATEEQVIQRSTNENFFLIPGGRAASNPAELIANGRMKVLLERVGPLFSWIVFDTPPAVPVSDASRLAELCDGVVLVVNAGVTPFDVAQKAREEFKDKPVLGVVLNRVAPKATYSAYYYSSYERERTKQTEKN
jgi:capsular exopolysaccharide synthesis family protein